MPGRLRGAAGQTPKKFRSPLLAGPINKSYFGGLAVDGYDVVAYFKDDKAVKGKEQFKTEHAGAKYRFQSAAHRKAFQANPEKYLPQYAKQ